MAAVPRRATGSSAALGILLLSWVVVAATGRPVAAFAAAADEIHWTLMGQTAVTFDWRGTDTVIHYGLNPAYGQDVTAVSPNPMPYSSTGPFWEARITGLQENTLYHYAIGNGPDHTFRTPPPRGSSNFTISVEGDIGDSTSYSWVMPVQNGIAQQAPFFALLVGDLTYANDHGQAHVDTHFNNMMVWSRDAAYMPAWGNHEWDASTDDFRNYKGRFDLPNPRSAPGAPVLGGPGKDWYWFDFGNVRFIAYPEPFSGAWVAWQKSADSLMTAVDSDPQIAFVVTFGHRPAYSSDHHPGDPLLKSITDGLGVKHPKYVLDLCGHSHGYERSYPQSGVTHVTVGIGGASLEVDGSLPCEWLGGCPPPSWSAFRAMRHGSLQLHFTPGSIVGTGICGPSSPVDDFACTPGSSMDSFLIQRDHPPAVLATATATAPVNTAFSLGVTAADPDGQTITALTADLSRLPAGNNAVFTPNGSNTAGTLTWTPTPADAPGPYPVTFTATNALSGSATTSIAVTGADRPPVTTAPAAVTFNEGQPVSIDVTASDPDGDPITLLVADLSLLPAGNGAAFTSNAPHTAGTLTWQPDFSTAGTYLVSFQAANALTSAAARTSIQIVNVDRPPVVDAPAIALAHVSRLLKLLVTASDPDGDAISSITADLSALPAGNDAAFYPGNLTGTGGGGTHRPPVGITAAGHVTPTPHGMQSLGHDPPEHPGYGTTGAPPGSNDTYTFVWSPTYRDTGSFPVTFTAHNALTGTATTRIVVGGGSNRAPVVTVPHTASVAENALLTLSVGAADADGDAIASLSADLSGLPAGNDAVFAPNAGNTAGTLTWTPAAGMGRAAPYTVTFTAANALAGADSTAITVDRTPVASLALSPATGPAPLLVTLDAGGSTDADGSIVSYTFDFGDGSPPAGPQAASSTTHTYAAGAWTAAVTVVDNGGATATASQPITVTSSGVAPAYVGRIAGVATTSSSSSKVLTSSRAVAAGDAILVGVQLTSTHPGPVVVTDAAGNAYSLIRDQPDGSGGDRILMFSSLAVNALAQGATITVTYPATAQSYVAIDEFTGLLAVDQSASAFATGTSFNSGNTATTAQANELLYGIAGVESGNAQAWAAAWTALPTLSISADHFATAYQVVNATGAYNASGTASGMWMAGIVTFMAAPLAPAVASSGTPARPSQPAALSPVAAALVFDARVVPTPVVDDAVLSFTLTRPGRVRIDTYDVNGTRAGAPVERTLLSSGHHEIVLVSRATDWRAGVFFYRLRTDEGTRTGRFVISH